MYQIFEKGGPIMWPLLVLSFLTLTVSVERLLFLFREQFRRERGSLEEMMKCLREDTRREKALEVAFGTKDPVARVVGYGLQHGKESFEAAISRAAERDLDRFGQGLALLDTAITLAPLLGLLGTVTGMIKSFGLLGAAELDAPVAITGGIAEALIATAFGLGIAITALIPFNICQTARERRLREIEDSASSVELLLERDTNTQQVKAA